MGGGFMNVAKIQPKPYLLYDDPTAEAIHTFVFAGAPLDREQKGTPEMVSSAED
jgi:hypothetical protein